MHVKDSLSDLIGKIISGVVVGQFPKGNPRTQIYLTFSDGTAFEFWEHEGSIANSYIDMAGYLVDGGVDQIAKKLERRPGAKITVFRAPHEDPDAIQRDMLTDDGG